MRSERLFPVFEVLFYVSDDHPQAHGGAMGNGSFISRFRTERDAKAFAAEHPNPSTGVAPRVSRVDVPRRLASRWGCA